MRWLGDAIGEMPVAFLRLADSPGEIITRGNATAEYLRDKGTTVISSLTLSRAVAQ